MDYTGKLITTEFGRKIQITKSLSDDMNGSIYGETSGAYVVKFLEPMEEEVSKNWLKSIKNLQSYKLPSGFTMPLDTIIIQNEAENYQTIGFLMPKVQNNISLSELLKPIEGMALIEWYNDYSGGLKRRLQIASQISMFFYLMHRRGKAFGAISTKSILITEEKGIPTVNIVGLENMYMTGANKSNNYKSSRYAAPEILNNQLEPDSTSDDYSLAIIIYELLSTQHPFVGDTIYNGSAALGIAAFKGLMAFIDDPNDKSNASTTALPRDIVFNPRLSYLLTKTFIDGKTNRISRATALDFAVSCHEASNALIRCQNCDAWYFPSRQKSYKSIRKYECPWCTEEATLPPYVSVRERFPDFEEDRLNAANGKAIESKTLKTIFLREHTMNCVTRNYTKLTIYENDVVAIIDEKKKEIPNNFKNDLLVEVIGNNHCEITNTTEQTIFVRRNHKTAFEPLKPMQQTTVSDKDCVFFDDLGISEKNFVFADIQSKPINRGLKSRIFLRFNLIQIGGNA